MIRQNWNGKEYMNKVRKRGGSSSSSSSLVQSYRLKRAVLVGKRGGGSNSTTPVPLWKMNLSRSPSLKNDSGINSSKLFKNLQQQQQQTGKVIGSEKDLSVSARKLGATLWEINGVLTTTKKEENLLKSSSLSKFDSVALQLSDPSQISLVSERMERSKVGNHRSRTSIGSHRILQTDFSLQNGCLIEVDQTQNRVSNVNRHRLKDIKNGLSASKELLKVLNRMWDVEEHQSTCLSLFSAMKGELDRACIQITKLIHEQRYNSHGEIDVLLKQFEAEKASWKLKEQDNIHAAMTSIAKELKVEKKLRKQTERLNKKLGKELADTKSSLSKVTKEVEGEKRAREILEQVCDELARGIGEDRAEAEELKRQSVKVREEVEKEREMLQLADVLREERVQMKLSEAKYQFEEKNAVVDKLRNELEAYLRSKKGQEHDGESPNYERIKELERHLRETLPSACYYQDQEKENGEVLNKKQDGDDDDEDEDEEDDDDEEDDSDLHSIELNMDDNTQSYQWCNVLQDDPKRSSVSDKSKARRSIPRQSISIERETSDGIEWEFSEGGGKENVDTFDKGRSINFLENGSIFEFSSQVWRKDCEDEIERYKMIKDLRDHIVSTSRKTPSQQGFSSPTKNWINQQQNLPSNDAERVMNEAFAVLQGAN